MNKIKIYTSKTCPYCYKLKEIFDKNKIKYEEKNSVEYQDEWLSIQKLTGLATFPTTVKGDNYYIPGRDYNTPEQLVQIIKSNIKDDFPIELKTKEAMKTLIYSINQVFNKIIHDLNQLKNEHKSTD